MSSGTSTSVGDNSSMPLKKKVSNSPDITTKKTEKKKQQAHFSTAGISSIDPDEDFGDDYREVGRLIDICSCDIEVIHSCRAWRPTRVFVNTAV